MIKEEISNKKGDFIRLIQLNDEPLFISVKNLTAFKTTLVLSNHGYETCTRIEMSDGRSYNIKESPDKIWNML